MLFGTQPFCNAIWSDLPLFQSPVLIEVKQIEGNLNIKGNVVYIELLPLFSFLYRIQKLQPNIIYNSKTVATKCTSYHIIYTTSQYIVAQYLKLLYTEKTFRQRR